MRSALPLPRSCTHACSPALGKQGFDKGTTFAIGQDRLLGRKDVQIRRERAQRTKLQSAYESPPKARPSMAALEGDKFMKSIMVAAGASLSPEYSLGSSLHPEGDCAHWHGFRHARFPANSPDLNPLDHHVWAAWQYEVNKVLKERFAGQVKNEMEMKAAVQTEWIQVDQNAVKRSIASWPKRLFMCIEKEGGSFEDACGRRAL